MPQSPHDAMVAQLGTGPLAESDRHDLLAADRRRIAIEVLAERSLPVTLDDLVDGVLEREAGAESPTDTQRSKVALSLHHIHLPAMADYDVVEYDYAERRIE